MLQRFSVCLFITNWRQDRIAFWMVDTGCIELIEIYSLCVGQIKYTGNWRGHTLGPNMKCTSILGLPTI